MIKRICKIFLTLLLVFTINVVFAFAESKESKLITLDAVKDIVVTFTFDKEVVDIEFINPAGEVVKNIEKEVNATDNWVIYSIKKASPGEWKIRYDSGKNESIDYSIVEQEQSIVIDYLRHTLNNNEIETTFKILDQGNKTINYEVIAVDNNVLNEEEQLYKLKSGTIDPNVDAKVNIGLLDLPSGTYRLKLNAHRDNGDFEVFDTLEDTESITYDNPWEPKAILDFDLYIDKTKANVIVDYGKYLIKNAKKYKVTLYENGKVSYSNEVDKQVESTDYLYNKDNKDLTIGVSYLIDKLWSKPKIKTISLTNEYLDIRNLDVVGDSYLSFIYKTATPSNLHIDINGKVEEKMVSGEGSINSYLDVGKNDISALLQVSDTVYFQIDQKKNYVILPPSIKLYEDLDGKTVYADKIYLTGRVRNSNSFTINGKEIGLNDSEFNTTYSLPVGKNNIEFVAKNAQGDIERIEITVNRKYSLSDLINDYKNNILHYKALLITIAVGLVLIILSIIFVKKRKNRYSISPLFIVLFIATLAFDGFLVYKYFERVRFTSTMGFVNMTERSLIEASRYLTMTDNLLKLIYVVSGFAVLMLILFIVKIVMNVKQNKNAS